LRGQQRADNELVVGFHLAGFSIRGPTARLEGVTVEAISQPPPSMLCA